MVCGLIKYQEIGSVVPTERGGKDSRVCIVSTVSKGGNEGRYLTTTACKEQWNMIKNRTYKGCMSTHKPSCNSLTTNKFTLCSKQVKWCVINLPKSNFIYWIMYKQLVTLEMNLAAPKEWEKVLTKRGTAYLDIFSLGKLIASLTISLFENYHSW